jgi:hypothetical protein
VPGCVAVMTWRRPGAGRTGRAAVARAGRSPSAEAAGRTAAPAPGSGPALTLRPSRSRWSRSPLGTVRCVCSRLPGMARPAGAAAGRALEAVEELVTGRWARPLSCLGRCLTPESQDMLDTAAGPDARDDAVALASRRLRKRGVSSSVCSAPPACVGRAYAPRVVRRRA